MNQEVVAPIDFEAVARADEGRHGALFDQERSLELAAGPQIGAVVDRQVAPAVRRIDPDLASLTRLGRRSLRCAHRRRRPVEPAAANDAIRAFLASLDGSLPGSAGQLG